jgi:ribonucleoside-triphosphate reductase
MVNFLGTLQNERAGAQAFSSFDTYLAPYVHKYRSSLEDALSERGRSFDSEEEKHHYLYQETYTYVVQQMQNFIFGLNVPSRRGTQTPFTNITLDLVCPQDLREQRLHL